MIHSIAAHRLATQHLQVLAFEETESQPYGFQGFHDRIEIVIHGKEYIHHVIAPLPGGDFTNRILELSQSLPTA